MNIGIDIREICVSNTGIGQYTRNLLNYLITKKSEHYNFFLYTNTGELNEFQKELPENFKFIKYKTTNTIFDFYALPKLIKKNKIDLFFSPYYKFPYLAQCPCVITVHDIGFITFPIQYYARSRFYRLFASRLLEYSLNRSARIFAVSNFTKSEILENYNIPSEKISVLYNTTNKIFDISLKTIEKNKIENLRKQYGRFILSVSNYKP
ncbi:MAG TPA: glycosyltransferase, partial [bacterium]|nr:glycosyltransferase [bacterium]